MKWTADVSHGHMCITAGYGSEMWSELDGVIKQQFKLNCFMVLNLVVVKLSIMQVFQWDSYKLSQKNRGIIEHWSD